MSAGVRGDQKWESYALVLEWSAVVSHPTEAPELNSGPSQEQQYSTTEPPLQPYL